MRHGGSKASLRCLIVEDDELQTKELTGLLAELRHSVVGTAATVDDALRIAEDAEIDVAIIGLSLKGHGFGGDVAELLLRRGGVPSVVLSAYLTLENRDALRSLGVTALISKPLDPAVLDMVLDRIGERAETISA